MALAFDKVPWPGNHPSQGFHKPRKTMKKQPKPLDAELTKQGKPRQRAPGAGRPAAGRDRNLPRVSPEAHAIFTEIKEALGFKNLADAIEHAAQVTQKKLNEKLSRTTQYGEQSAEDTNSPPKN